MIQVTLSDKYQVVIPKTIRKDLGLRPGQKVTVSKAPNGCIAIDTSPVDQYHGILAGKKLWGSDPAAHVRKARDDWAD